MLQFLLKRSLNGFLVILGVAIIVFMIFQVLPGDPAQMAMGQRSDVSSIDAINKEFYLDKSLPEQLVLYLNDLSPIGIHSTNDVIEKYDGTSLLKFGTTSLVLKTPYLRRSIQTNRPVFEILSDRLTGTLVLAISAMIFASIIGIIMGIIAALKHNTIIDHALVSISALGISAPSFVAATLIAYVLAVKWHDYTGLNLTGHLFETHAFTGRQLVLKNLILPALTLGIRPLAIITQLTRSSMLDVMSQDYIRTAKAKGMSQKTIVVKHALKNALNPVITAVSGWLASLMAGAFFIEYIFGWKGLGSVTIDAVFSLDFPVVMGATLFIASIFVIVNLVVDVIYGIIDPRIKLS